MAHELEGVRHLAILDDDVDGHVHARAREVRGSARLGEGVVGEVLRLAARVERAHAEVDGIGSGSERGGEGRRAACGREELGGAGGHARGSFRHTT